MLLARGLQHQGQAFCEGLEKDLVARDERIRALEQELEAANKLAEENATARRVAEEQVEQMRKDFEGYQKKKRDERKKVLAGAQRAANVYKGLLESVGEETEMPRDPPIVDFMEWLSNELATVNDYMTVGREYASFEFIRSFAQVLEECGCDHLEKFEVNDPQAYCNALAHAHEAGKRFFDRFWHPGGRDLALLRAAMTWGKVISAFLCLSYFVTYEKAFSPY